MNNRNGQKWNREETILAFDLYCRTPFGKITQNNPSIIELAKLLGRTPGSVGLKMHNLAHYDPELRERNIVAMAHGSKLDGEIFNEFADNWSELSYQAQTIKARLKGTSVEKMLSIEIDESFPPGEERNRQIKGRVNQQFFREAVLNAYDNRCCITGLALSDALIASHIKPWNISDERTERTNPSNGLCLNAFHDKAFDQGFITVNKIDYRIIVSPRIKEASMDPQTRSWLLGYEGNKIILPEKFLPRKDFLEYHNDVVFQR